MVHATQSAREALISPGRAVRRQRALDVVSTVSALFASAWEDAFFFPALSGSATCARHGRSADIGGARRGDFARRQDMKTAELHFRHLVCNAAGRQLLLDYSHGLSARHDISTSFPLQKNAGLLPLIDPVLGPHVPCLKPLPSFVPFHAGKNGGRSAASRSNCTIRPAGDVG